MLKVFYNILKRSSPLIYIAVIAGVLAAFLLRNLSNWDYPLAGEFHTSPFHNEILQRSLNVWDERFGLGFSNLLNSPGQAQYANVYSGAIWVTSNIFNALFQWFGAAYFFHQAASIFLFAAGVYLVLSRYQLNFKNLISAVVLSVAVVIIIQSTDFFINMSEYANRFLAGHGIMLIAFFQYRQLSSFGYRKIYSFSCLIPLALSLASLLLVFSSYFLVLVLFVGIQGMIVYICAEGKRNKVLFHYAKILAICIFLVFVIYGYVVAPSFLITDSTLMSGSVGRHDSPMQLPLIDIIRFFNYPVSDRLGMIGNWLQFSLAFLGLILAMFSSRMRQWARVDLISILIFIFLAKGSAPPFSEINHWLHNNIPFLRLLGSSYPYLGIIYTVLIYYIIYGFIRAFNIAKKSLPRTGVYIAWLVVIFCMNIAVFRNDAYLSGDFGGRVQAIEYPTEYYDFKKIAEKEMQSGRAYYFPDKDVNIGLDYIFSPLHPHRSMGCCWDLPFSSVFPININWANFTKNSGYYGQTMAFLMQHYIGGDELSGILSEADTRYVVFDLTLKKTSPAANRMLAIRDQVRISKSFEFMSALSTHNLEVYENKNWHSAALVTQNITLGTDDPNIFLEVARGKADILEGKILVSSAVTLLEALNLKRNNILSQVLLYNSDEMGLMLDMIHSNYEIKPDPNFLSSTVQPSWYKYNRVYQIQDTEKYGGRFIGRYPVTSSSEGALASYFAISSPGIKNKLFVRAMVSPDSGMIMVHMNGKKRPLNLRSNGYVGFQWFDLGESVDFTGNTKIVLEALDAGYLKRIDVVSLVPEDQVVDSLDMMRNLLSEIHIKQVFKTDFLQWMSDKDLRDVSRSPSHDYHEIKPKKLFVSNHNFSLSEDFDRFDGIAGQEVYNIIGQDDGNSSNLYKSFEDKLFLRSYGGIHQRFIASADIEVGTYSLGYELVSCQAFFDLTINLRTAYVSVVSPIHFYVSYDALSWTRVATRISDNEGNQLLDLSGFARGKKKIYLKISYEKLNKGLNSINLLHLKINGVAGEKEMRCASTMTQVLNQQFNLQDLKTDLRPLLQKLKDGESTPISDPFENINREHVNAPSVALNNKAFDPNWRMGDLYPFNLGYGFSAFLIANGDSIPNYRHYWKYKYQILLLSSAGFYFLLWFAFIWNIYRCERQRCMNRCSAEQKRGIG